MLSFVVSSTLVGPNLVEEIRATIDSEILQGGIALRELDLKDTQLPSELELLRQVFESLETVREDNAEVVFVGKLGVN